MLVPQPDPDRGRSTNDHHWLWTTGDNWGAHPPSTLLHIDSLELTCKNYQGTFEDGVREFFRQRDLTVAVIFCSFFCDFLTEKLPMGFITMKNPRVKKSGEEDVWRRVVLWRRVSHVVVAHRIARRWFERGSWKEIRRFRSWWRLSVTWNFFERVWTGQTRRGRRFRNIRRHGLTSDENYLQERSETISSTSS